jgi:hypothetical protein
MSDPQDEKADTCVWVRRQWNDHRQALYRLEDIRGLHWDSVSGGVRAKAPQQFLHGYVDCDAMLEGEIAHSGLHGPCPHSIKVCVLKKDNDPKVYRLLEKDAGERTSRKPSCARQALRMVGEVPAAERTDF